MHPLNTDEGMKMKIKCIDNKGNEWFTIGKEYRAWINTHGELWSESDCSVDCFHVSMNNPHGAFEMVEEEKSHPHADLMLKYAMIAQYDDKPWDSFEVLLDGEWVDCEHEGLYAGIEYRLKPQEPKIQAGQVWADKTGIIVSVSGYDSGSVYIKVSVGGLVIPWSFSKKHFLNNFKLQENK